MKKRILSIILTSAFLVGCSGHDYEGEWKASFDSSLAKNGGMDRFARMMGTDAPLVIGPDYVEQNGERVDVDIFERQSAGKQYLVIKSQDGEDVFTIVDDDTLHQGNALISVTYKRSNR